MAFHLARPALQAGYRLEGYDTVGSTNALALQRAGEGDPGKLWIAALAQTNGRGRRGRPWASPHGNLSATALMGLASPRYAATLGFVAGLALAHSLAEIAPQAALHIASDGAANPASEGFSLKWPNDVLVGGAKLAGILLESASNANGFSVAVGIGVNVETHPEGLPYPATSLRTLGLHGSAEDVFAALSARWAEYAAIWDGGNGRDEIRRRWLGRAAGLGAEAAVRVDGEVLRGVFETIDEDCRFVLRTRDGTLRRISAGDVHFGVVATAGAA